MFISMTKQCRTKYASLLYQDSHNGDTKTKPQTDVSEKVSKVENQDHNNAFFTES